MGKQPYKSASKKTKSPSKSIKIEESVFVNGALENGMNISQARSAWITYNTNKQMGRSFQSVSSPVRTIRSAKSAKLIKTGSKSAIGSKLLSSVKSKKF
jgi:hypothetical protein